MCDCKCKKNIDLKIKYHDKNMPKIEKIEKGNWIDLRAVEGGNVTRNGKKFDAKWETKVKIIDGVETPVKVLSYKAGDYIMISLGITIAQPTGYEVYIAPRSSTFKNYGFLAVNSWGIGDDTFRGNNDIYHMPVYATRDGEIELYERVCQFRLQEVMPELIIREVEDTGYEDRGSFGSTGIK